MLGNRVRFLSILLLIGAVIQTPVYAQLTAQLTGVIRDASGAIIPAAAVTVVNEGTGIKWDAKANQAGIYTVPLLQPGSYRVSVQAQGFRAVSRTGVQLDVAQTAAMDFTLDVGAASESITVTDSAPLLDSGSNAIGGLVTSEKVEDLPLLGRNSNALVMLVPGVRATRQTTVNPVLESHYQFFSINGSRPNQNQFMLDGGNNTNLTFNGPEYSPQVEEVQEFRIQTSNFSAEYANSGGGVINVVSKSGTNRFRGSLFEYFRHDKLTANDFFSNRSGRARPSSATISSVEPSAGRSSRTGPSSFSPTKASGREFRSPPPPASRLPCKRPATSRRPWPEMANWYRSTIRGRLSQTQTARASSYGSLFPGIASRRI